MSTVLENGFTQRYLMRRVSKDIDSVIATLPKAVIQRAARRRGLTLDEFLADYQLEYVYDGADEGFWGRFVQREKTGSCGPEDLK